MKKNTAISVFVSVMCMVSTASLQSCVRSGNVEKPAARHKDVSVELIPETVRAGGILRAVVSGAEGMEFRWERNGEALSSGTETLDTSGFRKNDVIKVSVSSGGSESSAQTALLNSVPVISSIKLEPGDIRSGVDIKAAVESSDTDGDRVTYDYQWYVSGQRVYSQTGPVLDGTHYRRGDKVSLRVIPHDGEEEGAFLEAEASVALNSPPVFSTVPPVEFSGTFIYAPRVVDPDGDSANLKLVKGPEGMKLEDGGIEWDAKGSSGSFEVVLTADDGNGGQARQGFELKVAE